jgi:hypothetical protein
LLFQYQPKPTLVDLAADITQGCPREGETSFPAPVSSRGAGTSVSFLLTTNLTNLALYLELHEQPILLQPRARHARGKKRIQGLDEGSAPTTHIMLEALMMPLTCSTLMHGTH